MIRRSVSSATLLVTVFTAAATSGKPIDLAPRFEAGAQIYYLSRSRIQHRVQVELADVDQNVDVTTESGMGLRVLNVGTNGSADLEWTLHFVAIASDNAMPGIAEKLDYDSRKPGSSSSPLAAMFAPLLSKPIAITVDAAGKVLRFDAPPAGDPIDPLSAIVRSMLSPQAFEQLPLFITTDAPRPAQFRAEWSTATSIELPLNAGGLEIQETFRFERISPRRSLARIRMQGTITQAAVSPQAGAGVAALAPQALLSVEKGKVHGVYLWDYSVGRIATAETTIDLTTNLNSVLGPMRLTQKSMTALKSATAREIGLPIERTPRPSPTPTPASEKAKHDD